MSYVICEQQRRRSACASARSDQRLCCSLPRQNGISSLYIRNFKILAGVCSLAGNFVACLIGDSRRYIFSWRGSSVIKHIRRVRFKLTKPLTINTRFLLNESLVSPSTLLRKHAFYQTLCLNPVCIKTQLACQDMESVCQKIIDNQI